RSAAFGAGAALSTQPPSMPTSPVTIIPYFMVSSLAKFQGRRSVVTDRAAAAAVAVARRVHAMCHDEMRASWARRPPGRERGLRVGAGAHQAPVGAPRADRAHCRLSRVARVAPHAPPPGHTRAMHRSGWLAASVLVTALAAAPPASADDRGTPFDQG